MSRVQSVVVTDDDGVLRQLIKLVLDRSADYTVVGEASDAEGCISAVRTLQPDVVLLDLGMPGLNGLDAIPALKDVAPRSLVIVLSAHPRERMAATAQARGADGYLEKGNLVTDLVPTLTEALMASRPDEATTSGVLADPERLAAVAAHDLRGQLLGIAGYAQLLARPVGADQAALVMVEQIRLSVDGGLALVDDLLTFGSCLWRQEPPVDVDLDQLAAKVVGLDSSCVRVGPLGKVHADPALVRPLLHHLLHNALTYVAPDVTPRVEVTAETVGDLLRVRVSDNGLRIPADERAAVFEPFQRGSTAREVPGTGLGLAICRAVVTRYGGSIAVQDSPYGGTSMIFTLPRAGAS